MNKSASSVIDKLVASSKFSPCSTLVGIVQREYLLLEIYERFHCSEGFSHEPIHGEYTAALVEHHVHLGDTSHDGKLIDRDKLRGVMYKGNKQAFDFSVLMYPNWSDLEAFMENHCPGCIKKIDKTTDDLPFEEIKLLYDELKYECFVQTSFFSQQPVEKVKMKSNDSMHFLLGIVDSHTKETLGFIKQESNKCRIVENSKDATVYSSIEDAYHVADMLYEENMDAHLECCVWTAAPGVEGYLCPIEAVEILGGI